MENMYNYDNDFLMLDGNNDLLPKKNILLTLTCCFIFYNIVFCDICLAKNFLLMKILQFSIMILNLISLLLIVKRDPGKARNLQNTSKNVISFLDNKVIYTRKMLTHQGIYVYNDDICEKCSVIQKDMISHCRYCDICLMNRDHHCAWFNRCIAENNINPFRYFLVSASSSAFLIVCDTIMIFSSGILFNMELIQILTVFVVLILSMLLFVLTGVLSLQYGISALLGIQNRKLLNGDWEWRSTRIFTAFKKKKIQIDEYEEF